jgi:hypothetical protein
MSRSQDDEPLFEPWMITSAKIIGPLAVLGLLYWLLTSVFNVPPKIFWPVVTVLGLSGIIYFGGRYYKPFHYDKATGRCTARGAKQRLSCRRYFPGARLGGGCGRQREDGRCRYVHG